MTRASVAPVGVPLTSLSDSKDTCRLIRPIDDPSLLFHSTVPRASARPTQYHSSDRYYNSTKNEFDIHVMTTSTLKQDRNQLQCITIQEE